MYRSMRWAASGWSKSLEVHWLSNRSRQDRTLNAAGMTRHFRPGAGPLDGGASTLNARTTAVSLLDGLK